MVTPESTECECGIRHPLLNNVKGHEKPVEPFVPVWRRRATVKDLTGQLRVPDEPR